MVAEQIFDVPVPETAEQLVEVPETVSDDRIQQRTAEHIAVIPVPQDVKELVVVFRGFSQDRIQQRTVEQNIPVTSLAEKIVELPVIQTEERTQQGVNTRAQHVVDTVEVERPEIIKQTGQKLIIQEKINQVIKPVAQCTDKVADIPVVAQRQISMDQTVQKTMEIPQLQCADHVNDVPAAFVEQVPQVHVGMKTVEIAQLQLVAQVPRVLVVEKTTEIPQFGAAELLKFNTSKPGDEQISLKEYVDCKKEGQNDVYCIASESNAMVLSSPFLEILRNKGYEVPYMAEPVDEYAVHQPEEFAGKMLKSTTEEEMDLGDDDEKKTLEELNTEFEPLAELTEGALGDKGEKVIVSDRIVDSPCVLTTSEYGWSAKMERIMEAQALRDNLMTSHMVSKKTTEVNPTRSIMMELKSGMICMTTCSSNNSASAASLNPPSNQQDKREGEKGRRKKGTRKGERRKKGKLRKEVNRSKRT